MADTDRDLAGRVFVVTGGNTGIGRATAVELARRGARVVIAARSRDKTGPVIEAIRRDTGNDAVEFHALDLGDLAAVRRSAHELLARDLPIHGLIANAGVGGQRGRTADGFELQFGVNHVGHFLFTTLLLGRIRESAPARVVVVSSQAHYRARGIDYEAVRRPTRSITGMAEYSMSKLANVLFAAELARRLAGTGVTTYSVHPGVIASDIWRRIPWPLRPLATAFMKSTEDGARTQLWCATAPELSDETGLYYDDCARRTPGEAARDEALAAQLWQRSEAWCAEALAARTQ